MVELIVMTRYSPLLETRIVLRTMIFGDGDAGYVGTPAEAGHDPPAAGGCGGARGGACGGGWWLALGTVRYQGTGTAAGAAFGFVAGAVTGPGRGGGGGGWRGGYLDCTLVRGRPGGRAVALHGDIVGGERLL